MLKLLKQWALKHFGAIILVQWEKKIFVHGSWDFEDALAWAACYPANASVAVYFRGKFIAARG